MTENITFSRPYAEAAYKIATEDSSVDLWLKDMRILATAIKNEKVKAMLASPKINKSEKVDFLMELTDGKNQLLAGFLDVLIENKKIYFVDFIYDLYQEMVLNDNNITIATIDTAFSLSTSQKKSIQGHLEKIYNKKIMIEERIDKSLLAGIKISVDNHVTDHSVKYRLNLMKEQILNRQV